MRALNLLLLFCFVATVACVTKGYNFRSDLSWIKKETTSQQDVLMILGTPFMVGNSSGVPTWSYGLYHYRLVGRSYVKELKVFWNDNKTVRDYSFQSSFPDDLEQAGVPVKRDKHRRKKQELQQEQQQSQQQQPSPST